MLPFTERILQDYHRCLVRGMISGDQIQIHPEPTLAHYGLAGVSVDKMGFRPAHLRKLQQFHILSVGMLCSLHPNELQKLGVPPAYVSDIERKLGDVGLSLGMGPSQVEQFSRDPSAAFLAQVPEFHIKAPTPSRPLQMRSDGMLSVSNPVPNPASYDSAMQSRIRFKFGSAKQLERFYHRATDLFTRIMQIDEGARSACSSHAEQLMQPLMRLPSYRKNNGDDVYPLAMSRDMLEVLAVYAPQHPELLEALMAEEIQPCGQDRYRGRGGRCAA